MAKKKNNDGKVTLVRRFEITGFGRADEKIRDDWKAIADDVRGMMNCIWQQWETYHVRSGNDVKVRQFCNEFIAYRRSQEAGLELPRPSLTVNSMPATLSKDIYKILTSRFASSGTRLVSCVLQSESKKMTGKDANGVWSKWISILNGQEGRPSVEKSVAIPIPKDNVDIQVEDQPGGFKDYQLVMRLVKVPGDKYMRRDVLTLKTRPDSKERKKANIGRIWKQFRSSEELLDKIIDGTYELRNVQIVREVKHRKVKWYAHVAYKKPIVHIETDPNRTAVLHPQRDRPWALWINGFPWFPRINGEMERPEVIAYKRRQCRTGRYQRQSTYRYGSTSRRGHGRKRALKPISGLERMWTGFTKHYCQSIARSVVDKLIAEKVGRLVILVPEGDRLGKSRFLAFAGTNGPGSEDASWCWYKSVQSIISAASQVDGLKVETRTCSASGRKPDDKAKDKTVAKRKKKPTVKTPAETA